MPKKNGKLENIALDGSGSAKDYLGQQLLTSMGELLAPRDEVEAFYREKGLPGKYLPHEATSQSLNPIGCFKRSVQLINNIRTETTKGRATYLIRPVGPRIRYLVLEIQDIVNKKPKYQTKIGYWEMEGNGKLHTQPKVACQVGCTIPHRHCWKAKPGCNPTTCTEHTPFKLVSHSIATDDELKEVFEKIDSRVIKEYTQQMNGVGDQQFRAIHKILMRDLRSISMRRSGGVHFVWEEHREIVEKFSELYEWLNQYSRNGGEAIEMVTLPVVNDEKRRQLIVRKFEEDTIGLIDNLVTDVQKRLDLKEEEVPQKAIDGFEDRYARVLETIEYYTQKLKQSRSEFNFTFEKVAKKMKEAKDIMNKLHTSNLEMLLDL